MRASQARTTFRHGRLDEFIPAAVAQKDLGTDRGRLGAWVLALPIAVPAAIALGAAAFVGSRALRQRSRIRELQRALRD